jgi:hypothetical protein
MSEGSVHANTEMPNRLRLYVSTVKPFLSKSPQDFFFSLEKHNAKKCSNLFMCTNHDEYTLFMPLCTYLFMASNAVLMGRRGAFMPQKTA